MIEDQMPINLVSIVLPTFNEGKNIESLINKLLVQQNKWQIEIIVVDDDSMDGTREIVREISYKNKEVQLISRVGRSGLASAIKEGLINSKGEIAVVMDSDGQHDPQTVPKAIHFLSEMNLDLVIGSRFHSEAKIFGLSNNREAGSKLANLIARTSLPRNYKNLTDYMSGFFVIRPNKTFNLIRAVNVNGFKFLYELLSLSKGSLLVGEVPLIFLSRNHGISKLDLAIFWDFLISLIHSLTFRIIPRRAISFGLVGLSGIVVQLLINKFLMSVVDLDFEKSLPFSVVIAATSNYLINNALTFKFQRLRGRALIKGLLKFLLVASLPIIANVGLASAYYNLIDNDIIFAQIAGIVVVYIWNYAASSKFVWNTP